MKVSFGLTRTLQTKQYENVKIELHLEDECEKKDLVTTFNKMRKFVKESVQDEEDEWV